MLLWREMSTFGANNGATVWEIVDLGLETFGANSDDVAVWELVNLGLEAFGANSDDVSEQSPSPWWQ